MSQIRVAYHEAGHAVLAHITGVYEIDGPIITDGISYAETPIMRDAVRVSARSIDMGVVTLDELNYEEAIIAAAGQEAERIYLKANNLHVDETALSQGAHGDLCHVRELLGSSHWFEVCAAASQYLKEPRTWQIVEHLAQLILRKSGALTADQATEALERIGIELDIPPLRILRKI